MGRRLKSSLDRRGVAEFIAMLIILLVVVSLSVSLYAYSTGVFSSVGSNYQHEVSESKDRVEERFMVTAVYPETIRNYSDATLKNVVLINGTTDPPDPNASLENLTTIDGVYFEVNSSVNYFTAYYNFSSGAGANTAYEKQVSEKPPDLNNPDIPITNFTSQGYDDIKNNDTNVYPSVADRDYYAAHRFKFKILEDEDHITKINVTWIGAGWHDNDTGVVDGITLYIWNFDLPGYDQLNEHVDSDAQVKLTNESEPTWGDLGNYIGDDGSLILLVVQHNMTFRWKPKGPGGWQTEYSHISTDYVGLEVTWRTDHFVTYCIDYVVDVGSIDLASVVEINVTEKGMLNDTVDQLAIIEIYNWVKGGWEEVFKINQTVETPYNVTIFSANPLDYINETWGWINLTLRAVDSGDPFKDSHDWINIRITNETVPDQGDLYFHIFNFGKREIEVATIYLNGNPLEWGINVSATDLEITVYELEKVTIFNAPLEGHILIVTTRGNTYEFDYTRSMGRVYVMEG